MISEIKKQIIEIKAWRRRGLRASLTSQAVVEYIVTFIVIAIGVLLIFGAFNPEKFKIKTVFNNTITNAINKINPER